MKYLQAFKASNIVATGSAVGRSVTRYKHLIKLISYKNMASRVALLVVLCMYVTQLFVSKSFPNLNINLIVLTIRILPIAFPNTGG